MASSDALRSRQALLLTAALFSTGGVAIKAVHMSGPLVACLRSGIAAIALFLFLPESRRKWNARVLLLAMAYALTLVSFVLANRLTTSANAIFLEDTAPLYILVLSAFFLKEKPRAIDLWLMLPFAVAISLFFVGSQRAVETAPNPLSGNILAAVSGVFYACVVVGFRWMSRDGDESGSVATVGLGNVLSCLICLPFAWPIPSGHSLDWGVLIYLGVVQIALAYFLMTKAMKRVPAVEASLLLLLEPVLNPIWTWLVYREQPGRLAIVGGLLIIGATAMRTWWGERSAGSA